MIKCNVTVCGTVSRQAQMRANKEGTQFASFGINIVIPAKSGINKTVEISVAKTCNNLSELPPIQVGTRIEVAGILMFHKKGEALYLNLSATGINTFNASNNDGINGTMEFRGTLGKQIEDKTTKSGKSFTVFIIRKTKCFDFWERNVLFPKTKRSFFRTPTLPFSA